MTTTEEDFDHPMECIYCHCRYSPDGDLGYWPCLFHPDPNWQCCGLNVGDLTGRDLSRRGGIGVGWPIASDIRGCTRCDHTTRPWTVLDQDSVLHLAYRDQTPTERQRPGRSKTISNKAELTAFVHDVLLLREPSLATSPTLKETVEATASALLDDNWRDALVKDAPTFFRALGSAHPGVDTVDLRRLANDWPSFDRLRATVVNMHQAIKPLITSPLHRMATPMTALELAKQAPGVNPPYPLLADALQWLAQHYANADQEEGVAHVVMTLWEEVVIKDLAHEVIPFYAVRRFASAPNGRVLLRTRGLYGGGSGTSH